jgi:hypothetical protein
VTDVVYNALKWRVAMDNPNKLTKSATKCRCHPPSGAGCSKPLSNDSLVQIKTDDRSFTVCSDHYVIWLHDELKQWIASLPFFQRQEEDRR